MRREWIEIFKKASSRDNVKSPSMRREWIEMSQNPQKIRLHVVSLHAEGVD